MLIKIISQTNLLVLHTTTKEALVCKLQSNKQYMEIHIHTHTHTEIMGAKMRKRQFYKSSEECDTVERTFD